MGSGDRASQQICRGGLAWQRAGMHAGPLLLADKQDKGALVPWHSLDSLLEVSEIILPGCTCFFPVDSPSPGCLEMRAARCTCHQSWGAGAKQRCTPASSSWRGWRERFPGPSTQTFGRTQSGGHSLMVGVVCLQSWVTGKLPAPTLAPLRKWPQSSHGQPPSSLIQ